MSGGKLPSLSEMFRRADDEWTCDVCMVSNKLTASECVACAAPPPHSKPQGLIYVLYLLDSCRVTVRVYIMYC